MSILTGWIAAGGVARTEKDVAALSAVCKQMETTPGTDGKTLFMGFEPVAVAYQGKPVFNVWPAP